MLSKKRFAILFICFLFSFISCKHNQNYSHYYCGSSAIRHQLRILFDTLEKEKSPESRFIINLEIARILNSLKENSRLNAYLMDQINWNPEDPFNGYYLNLIANDFKERKMYKMTETYYKRIIRNHPPIQTNEHSIEEIALEGLTRLCEDPKDKIHYGKLLLEKYADKVETAQIHYIMAKSYEQIGMWQEFIESYKNFVEAPFSNMQGEDNLRTEAKTIIRYYEYPNKDWCYTNLQDLLNSVRVAIQNRDNFNIRKNIAKVNFFAVSWSQNYDEADRNFLASLGTFMRKRITFEAKIEKNPNGQEAYWQTNNWSHRISTWYLYFRKIDFPADPSVHGKWEWAGIYFGDKPFAATKN